MRTTILATAASALAAGALVAGAGTAAAAEEADQTEEDATPVCVVIETFAGTPRTMCLTPAMLDETGSLGYGSLGTGSLMDLLTGTINLGSTALSVDVPNSVGSAGSYAPGSTGSYGPEALVGQLLTGSIGLVAGSV